MTDVGDFDDAKSPEAMMAVMSTSPHAESSAPLQSTGGEVDSWIELLSKCKQLAEEDVKRLCDKVIIPRSKGLTSRHERYYKKNQMSNQYDVQ